MNTELNRITLDDETMQWLCENNGDGLIRDFYFDKNTNELYNKQMPVPEILKDKLDWMFVFDTLSHAEKDHDFEVYKLTLRNGDTNEEYSVTLKLRLGWDDWSEATFTKEISVEIGEKYSIFITDIAKFRKELITMIEQVKYSVNNAKYIGTSTQIAELFEQTINSNK